MHVVDGGPKVPGTVLDAQEKGELVFLCGSGISVRNDLPTFAELVNNVWHHFESPLDIEEVIRVAREGSDTGEEENSEDGEGAVDQALEMLGNRKFSDVLSAILDGAYDRAISCLERHYGQSEVRREVQDQLSVDGDADAPTHEALLDLATTNSNNLQLVTTNFDLLFEVASDELPYCAAPTLLVPKRGKWDSLVYLHGRIDERDPDGQHLVLDSADFGTAYLTERWASRFVSELFRNFTVVFVGYSVNDPVMRYMLDAVAADRQLSKELARETFAFVPHWDGESLEKVKTEWEAKNVTPIAYRVEADQDGEGDHSLLHNTLHQWAQLWRGGINARKNLAYELGRMDPAGLSNEDRSRFLWAISDPDVANHVAELGTEIDLGWTDVLKVEGWLQNVLVEHAKVSIVDAGHYSQKPPRLDDISRHLARWMAKHIQDPRLVEKIIQYGSHLHPDFLRTVNVTEIKEPALRKIWDVLSVPEVLAPPGDNFTYIGLPERLTNETWTISLRESVLRGMQPVIDLGKVVFTGYPGPSLDAGGSEQGEEKSPDELEERTLQVSDLTSAQCEVRAGDDAEQIVREIKNHNDADPIFADLGINATLLLREALDKLALLDAANRDEDPSMTHQPSIAPHHQNAHYQSWTWLVELCREAFDALLRTDRDRAKRLLDEWGTIHYPVFRRLSLYALQKLAERENDS